jgi:hypothetical protein
MKKLILLICFIYSFTLIAQIDSPDVMDEDPVQWVSSAKDLGDNEFLLTFEATIDNGWYLYSQHIESTPPLPTTIGFDNADSFEQISAIDEIGNMIEVFDETFDSNIRKYANRVQFQVMVKTEASDANITGYIEYMTCDDHKCLPPGFEEFNLTLTASERFTAPKSEMPAESMLANAEASEYMSTESELVLPNPEKPRLFDPKAGHENSPSFEEAAKKAPILNKRNVTNKERTLIIDQQGKRNMLVASNALSHLSDGELADLIASGGLKVNKPKPKKSKKAIKEAQKKKEAEAQKLAELKLAEQEEAKRASTYREQTDPIHWTYTLTPLSNGHYELAFEANIDENWYLYSKSNTGTTAFINFKFDDATHIKFIDPAMKEVGTPETINDPLLKRMVKRYANKVHYSQEIAFTKNEKLTGTVSYMASDGQKYLLPNSTKFTLNANKSVKVKKEGWFAKLKTVNISTVLGNYWRWLLALLALIATGIAAFVWWRQENDSEDTATPEQK